MTVSCVSSHNFHFLNPIMVSLFANVINLEVNKRCSPPNTQLCQTSAILGEFFWLSFKPLKTNIYK